MKNKIIVVSGKNRHTVSVAKGQTLTVWKLGDAKRGWIPSKKHFVVFKKLLTNALKNPSKNHIVFHYGVAVQQVKI